MLREIRLLGCCLAVGMVACASSGGGVEALPTLAPTEAASQDSQEPELETIGGRALNAGRLAYVGRDSNIYVVDAGSDDVIAVTDDADTSVGPQARAYHSPAWSPGGWLSYVMTEQGDAPGIFDHTVLAVRPGDEARQLYQTDAGSYVYGFWSPVACGQGESCGRFAFLMNGSAGGLELHMAQVRGDDQSVEEQILGEGGPFYYSWAPDGERMLWLRGGETLEIVDVNDVESSTVLPDEPGQFQAPWWSPVDDRLLFALAGEEGNQLVVADGEERDDLTGGEGGQLSAFAWSPDGRWLAYADGYAPTAYPFTSLRIVSDDGSDEPVSVQGAPVVAFFWAPDSQQLAYITIEDAASVQAGGRVSGLAAPAQQGQAVLVWYVADIRTGDSRQIVPFAPTQDEAYLLQFFDQFAQSHRVWSPDSTQIVYAEVLPQGGRSVVRVVDVTAPDAEPQTVAEGSLGVFSFE